MRKPDKTTKRIPRGHDTYLPVGRIHVKNNTEFEIIFPYDFEMSDGDLEFFINGYSDGNEPYHKPHIHIRNKDWSFHTAVRLDKPKYAMHEEKMSLLSEDQIKIINKFMRTKIKTHKETDETYWEDAKFCWWSDNHIYNKRYHKCPDYTKLLEKKKGIIKNE